MFKKISAVNELDGHKKARAVADELACGNIMVNTYKFFKEQDMHCCDSFGCL